MFTDTADSKNKTHLCAWWGETPGNGDRSLDAYNAWQSASTILEEWYADDKEISSKQHLDDKRKWAAKLNSMIECENRLAHLLEEMTRAADELAQAEAILTRSVEGSSNDTLAEVRAGEIRSWYSRLDEGHKVSELRAAVDSDDREVLSAILSAPRAFRLIPDLLRRHVVDTLIKQRVPEKITLLDRRRRAVRTALFALKRAQSFIQNRAKLAEEARRNVDTQAYRNEKRL